ncbi:peptidoglycan-binding domain-containing protein [Streptomyces sp. 4N124]|uniref:peptidoglycan-binding domain-containing protein n=1 Tax=Streptomyces sp. 4N124 TaxID=3457420 RepID=UPI003FD30817
MRVVTRALVSITAVAGILAGSLAGASASFAATETDSKPAASAKAVSPLAVNNLGLSTTQARYVQCWLMESGAGYPGPLDGLLGTESWKAFQRYLMQDWQYPGPIDGDPGPNTKMALQRMLMEWYDYPGPIDGKWGPNSEAAFKRFADLQAPWC